MAVAEYVAKITGLVDSLSVACDKFSDNDVALFILGGLGDEFEAFVQNDTIRENEVSFVQVQAMLVDLEICQERLATKTPSMVVSAATLVDTKKEKEQVVHVIPCQICNRKGHYALNCYKRLDISKFPMTNY